VDICESCSLSLSFYNKFICLLSNFHFSISFVGSQNRYMSFSVLIEMYNCVMGCQHTFIRYLRNIRISWIINVLD